MNPSFFLWLHLVPSIQKFIPFIISHSGSFKLNTTTFAVKLAVISQTYLSNISYSDIHACQSYVGLDTITDQGLKDLKYFKPMSPWLSSVLSHLLGGMQV